MDENQVSFSELYEAASEAAKVIIETLKPMLERLAERLDKIRTDIIKYESDCHLSTDEYPACKECNDNVFNTIYRILDKYKAESEGKE